MCFLYFAEQLTVTEINLYFASMSCRECEFFTQDLFILRDIPFTVFMQQTLVKAKSLHTKMANSTVTKCITQLTMMNKMLDIG